MYVVDLFAGAAGGILGAKYLLGWQTVVYVEKDEGQQAILKARIRDGLLDDAPIWSDIRSFTKRNNQCRRFFRHLRQIRSQLVVVGGFPCQPFSVAGGMLAENDHRNGWPDTIRIIREIGPAWVFLENVPGLLAGSHGYYGAVLRDLAQSGYDARWRVLSAAEVGAPHQRDRLWIVAYPDGNRRQSRGVQPQHTHIPDSAVFGDDGAAQFMAFP